MLTSCIPDCINVLPFSTATQNANHVKPRDIKIKQKTVRRAIRPVGGFEKSSTQRKMKKNEPNGSSSVLEAETIIHSQPYYAGLVQQATNTIYLKLLRVTIVFLLMSYYC